MGFIHVHLLFVKTIQYYHCETAKYYVPLAWYPCWKCIFTCMCVSCVGEMQQKITGYMVLLMLNCVPLLSSSRTSVRVKLGLFNAKIRNENCRYIHRLMYQLNKQDLLCHSI